MSETTIWTGSSSQLKNLRAFLLAAAVLVGTVQASGFALVAQMDHFGVLIGGVLTATALWTAWKWLQVRSQTYEITTERLLVTTGILDRKTELMELHQVRDMQVRQSLFERVVGLQTLHLLTDDRTTPEIVIDSAPAQLKLPDRLRIQVEACRMQKRVRVVDLDLDLDSYQIKLSHQ